MCRLLLAWALGLFAALPPAWGQSIPGVPLTGKPLQKKFTASVDQLDEFIDRFNHKDPMFVEAFPNRPQRPLWAERAFLVRTLVNPKARIDPKVTDAFVKQVSGPPKAVLLHLADKDWYAALQCRLLLDGKPVAAKLVLGFEQDTNGVEAWRLQAVQAPWLADAGGPPLPAATGKRRGLNPASHGNGFISLHRAFASAERFGDNLSDSATAGARAFAGLVAGQRLKLERVTQVVFHFLQVEGYVFTVSDVTAREGEPSGFLIGNLSKAGAEAKRKYRKAALALAP